MNILNSDTPRNKITFVVFVCLLFSNFGSMPATVNASTDASSVLTHGSAAACNPTITFTSVPPFGSTTELFLYGSTTCVIPNDFKIAVFIYPGSWWIKPSFAFPLTPINSDGTWMTKIKTGGIDELATRIAAFLLPNGVVPPTVGGNATLPQVLFDSAVAYLIQDRYRTIEFSGYTWNVKSSEGLVGPGPNYFSADANDVWVDGSGNLHLTIHNRNGKWYSTEVFTQASLGYGTYTFTLASPVDQLDRNAVLGLFTWDDTAPEYHYREIDIELSKWGDALNQNSQYVVQPWDRSGNIHRFNTVLQGVFSTYSFKWQREQVAFSSYQGHAPNLGAAIESWLYTGGDVPPAGKENARINLWLYNGLAPSNGQSIEVVLEAFNHDAIPAVASITRADPNPPNKSSVNFTVNFSEPVSGVNTTPPFNDFRLVTTGKIGASITGVSGSGSIRTVTVNTGSGKGTVRLDVLDDDSIRDGSNNPLGGAGTGNGNYSGGERYNMVIGADTAGVFRPINGLLYLKNKNETGIADIALNYGLPGDDPVVGDWDGNGTVTIGVYRDGYFYLRNENTIGFAEIVFPFGNSGDQPVAGDWNGDGVDTIGVFRPSTGQFLLRNSNSEGPAEMSFFLGNVGDVGIAGDWDGDGIDTTGVFRPSDGLLYLKNSNVSGFADVALNYGLSGDAPVTGDWNNDGVDTIGVYRDGLFYLRNSNTIGFAEIIFGLGNPGDRPIAGNWDGLP